MNIKKILFSTYHYGLATLGEFNSSFMLGLITGFMALAVVLFRFFGPNFAMSQGGQFHLTSYTWLMFCIPVAYVLLGYESNNGKRVLCSVMFPLMVFTIHDIYWLSETFFVHQIFKGDFIYQPTVTEYAYHYIKNSVNLALSSIFFFIYKYFRINKLFIVFLVIQFFTHVLLVVFNLSLVLNAIALLCIEIIDTLPFAFLVARIPKTKKDQSG